MRRLTYCLAEEGAADIRLTDIDRGRAEKLAALVGKSFPKCRIEVGQPDRRRHDRGRDDGGQARGRRSAADGRELCLTPDMTVVDIIMEPAETALLKAAKAIGCRVQPGRPMMDFQVEAMAEFFDIERKDRSHG